LREKKENNGALAPRLNIQETPRQILLRPQVWSRRQEMSQQQVPTGPAPIEGVERMNVVMVWSQ